MALRKKLTWKTEKRKVKELFPYKRNPRTVKKKKHKQLEKSLSKFGLVDIPAIDRDEKIISGHDRVRIFMAEGRGEEEIDVRVPSRSLTEKEFKELNLQLNLHAGEFDTDILASDFEIEELIDIGMEESFLLGKDGKKEVKFRASDKEKLCPSCGYDLKNGPKGDK